MSTPAIKTPMSIFWMLYGRAFGSAMSRSSCNSRGYGSCFLSSPAMKSFVPITQVFKQSFFLNCVDPAADA
ncbi:hypothetical protein F5H01DRAFT_192572 [Linnemannia elongata]|nr:hypothetical protein F5H01DRAFT_192572 [Linnemannia elongata]